MELPSNINGDKLIELIGLYANDEPVQDSLLKLARGKQPELDPEDESSLVDWVTVNELGLEYGFEDEAYVRALDPELRRSGPLILSQLYFYGDTPATRPFPFDLPFGLNLNDTAITVRNKFSQFEDLRRSYQRDAWRLPNYNVTVAYGKASGLVQSVFCYLPYKAWPALPDEEKLVSAFTPELFISLFGRRWSNATLMEQLAPLGYDEKLAQIRVEHAADLRTEHGIEFLFAPSKSVRAADQRYPRALSFAGVVFYANRELDARQWAGILPNGLSFSDTQNDLISKVNINPDVHDDENLSGQIVWHFDQYTLSVIYSNLENRPLRVYLLASGFKDASSS